MTRPETLSRTQTQKMTNRKMQSLGRRFLLPLFRQIERQLHEDLGDRISPTEITQSLYRVMDAPHNTAEESRQSAYLLFCDENKVRIKKVMRKQLGREPTQQEVFRQLGVQWTHVKESGKAQPYQERYEAERTKRLKERAEQEEQTELEEAAERMSDNDA